MTVLSAQTIRAYVHRGSHMIEPFVDRTSSHGMTYGLGPAGYDIRAAEDVDILPGGFVLGSSMERFQMPNNVLAYVKDKSSWARKGLCVQNTVIEPGWEGYLTLEYTNHLDRIDADGLRHNNIRIRRGMPIAQIIFHALDRPTNQPYDGKYQNQAPGPQEAINEPVKET